MGLYTESRDTHLPSRGGGGKEQALTQIIKGPKLASFSFSEITIMASTFFDQVLKDGFN